MHWPLDIQDEGDGDGYACCMGGVHLRSILRREC